MGRPLPIDITTAERSELLQAVEYYRQMGDEWIRRQVIENDRIDILATVVLKYQIKPVHLALLRYQFQHPNNLQLVFRGAGKTTVCTVTKAIHYVLKNANLRILIASKTSGNASSFLKEIKAHFEENEDLIRIFGAYYHPKLCRKWDDREIEVLPRTVIAKEATITTVGVDGTIVGKHYDVIIADDLVDEDNARTEHMRNKTLTWYYKTLDPTLEPPDPSVPHRGDFHRLGTRYHFRDLYGHLIANELAKHHNIIPALSLDGRSAWHEKYPPEWFAKKRREQGLIIFNSQYQCDTEAMKGEIFEYDDCQLIEQDQVPENLNFYMGIDLAVGEGEQNDDFAIVVVGVDKADNFYVFWHYNSKIKFSAQTAKIFNVYDRFDPTRGLIEANAYQKVQFHALKDKDKDIRIHPKTTIKDKTTRAWKLQPFFQDKRMFFVKTGNVHLLIEALVLFPNGNKDLFDAFDFAIQASRYKKRKKRRKVGII